MKLLSKERLVFSGIILALLAVIAYGAIWFNKTYVIRAVPREVNQEVSVCIKNKLACSLIYENKEDVPGLK